MPIALRCATCGEVFFFADDLAADAVACTRCGQQLAVPRRETSPPGAVDETPLVAESAAPEKPQITREHNPFAESPAPRTAETYNPYQSPHTVDPPHSYTSSRKWEGYDPRAAGLGKRFLGALADTLVAAAVVFLAIMLLGLPLDENPYSGPVIAAVLLVALGQAVLISMTGKSVGKLLLKTTIYRIDNNQRAGFVHGVLMRQFVPAFISNIPFVGGIFSIADVLFIFGSERRCLHDLIAGTKVLDDQLVIAYQNKEALRPQDTFLFRR